MSIHRGKVIGWDAQKDILLVSMQSQTYVTWKRAHTQWSTRGNLFTVWVYARTLAYKIKRFLCMCACRQQIYQIYIERERAYYWNPHRDSKNSHFHPSNAKHFRALSNEKARRVMLTCHVNNYSHNDLWPHLNGFSDVKQRCSWSSVYTIGAVLEKKDVPSKKASVRAFNCGYLHR